MKIRGRLRIKAGLPKLRIHDLRHQWASRLINSGSSSISSNRYWGMQTLLQAKGMQNYLYRPFITHLQVRLQSLLM